MRLVFQIILKRLSLYLQTKQFAPKNLYGATKLCSDKLFISTNNIIGKRKTKFSIVRYVNVNGSRGSVIPLFKHYDNIGKTLPVTDLEMTRFSITMNNAINLVFTAMKNSFGGEIFIPKIPTYKLSDLVKAINPKKGFKITGVRYIEKIHEELINFEYPNIFMILENITFISLII